MKLKVRMFLCCLIIVMITISACRQQSLLRFGNNASCLGFHGQYSPHLFTSWHKTNAGTVLILENTDQSIFSVSQPLQLQGLNPDTGETEWDIQFPVSNNVGPFALSENENVMVISTGDWQSEELSVYSLWTEGQQEHIAVIDGARVADWHPDQLLLAAIYYPEGYDQGSNVIALYDVSGSTPVQTQIIELKNIAISQILGWSNNGQVIAVSQYDKMGDIPYYIFPATGIVKQSLFHQSLHNCVSDGQWSPNEQAIAFSGENDETQGWDIFLETVATSGNPNMSLINLTNTPEEDEIKASWSPDGEHIVYVKVYEDTVGNLRQELYLLKSADILQEPIQLTDTPIEFEADPIWISNDEVAYLSWSSSDRIWSLNILSVSNNEQRKVLDISQSWYEESE